jgi:hypothetical protein
LHFPEAPALSMPAREQPCLFPPHTARFSVRWIVELSKAESFPIQVAAAPADGFPIGGMTACRFYCVWSLISL